MTAAGLGRSNSSAWIYFESDFLSARSEWVWLLRHWSRVWIKALEVNLSELHDYDSTYPMGRHLLHWQALLSQCPTHTCPELHYYLLVGKSQHFELFLVALIFGFLTFPRNSSERNYQVGSTSHKLSLQKKKKIRDDTCIDFFPCPISLSEKDPMLP